jgi:hypothetical protein
MDIPVIAQRSPITVYDTTSGDKWRGGVVRAIVGDTAILEVMSEPGQLRRYRGPAGTLHVSAPVCCRMVGNAIAELIDGYWGSSGDEQAARQRTPGVVSSIPESILERDGLTRTLWRNDMTVSECTDLDL